MGEVIAQPGSTRHDRGTILAVVGDERTDRQNGEGEDGQGLLPGNGLEESSRDRVNEVNMAHLRRTASLRCALSESS